VIRFPLIPPECDRTVKIIKKEIRNIQLVVRPAWNATPVEGNQEFPDMNSATVYLEASAVDVMR
jgi:hypothetical protein